MSDIPAIKQERVGQSPTRKGAGDIWGHLPEDKRLQYLAIEARVRDKMKKGEL